MVVYRYRNGGLGMFDFKFDWLPEMDSHIMDIDVQHQQLFKVGRDMEQLLRIKCIGVTDKQLLDIICQLRDFSAYHFYVEESLMEEMNYSKLEEHRETHKRYSEYIMNINLPKLKENPEKELRLIKDEIQEWIFEHVLHTDREFSEAYLAFKERQESEKEAEAERRKLVFVEGYGYKICSLDVSDVYLAKDQRYSGHTVVVYKEAAREFNRLTTLERNTYFSELSKVANAVIKVCEAKTADYVSLSAEELNFQFHVIPKYGNNDGLDAEFFDESQEVLLEEEELLQRILKIRKALNK